MEKKKHAKYEGFEFMEITVLIAVIVWVIILIDVNVYS